ncbi:hypothetical protein SAMN05518672_10631 [Chitinophaga sp. CF118]|nr:hypothetical protein SAMN05518672_10631 [Chitinophaga sp. CF118]
MNYLAAWKQAAFFMPVNDTILINRHFPHHKF